MAVISLLTDFGLQDGYVGILKGVIARINPGITVIDLSHQIPPQDIATARFVLMNAVPYFPPQTVHVAVVDPGVGSTRRAIAIQIAGGWLVGPDNGLFSGVISQFPAIAAVELTVPRYWRTPELSHTFHGRDLFAPVAAHLASGVPLQELGLPIDPTSLVQLPLPPLQSSTDLVTRAVTLTGQIQAIDHFGNLITTIPGQHVQNQNWQVQLGNLMIPGCRLYSDRPVGELLALVGSHGWVEIAANRGNAREITAVEWGTNLIVFLGPQGSMTR